MVKEVRIFFEGGGDRSDDKRRLKEGLHGFLREPIITARQKRICFNLILCGTRRKAYESFLKALGTHSSAFNILLVDSEGPVPVVNPNSSDHEEKYQAAWQYLRERPADAWSQLAKDHKESCHLMVQTMEAWLLADIEGLQKFYGQGFAANSIPKAQNVEGIDKPSLERTLKAATRATSKGEYHKIDHASKLLKEFISPKKVCDASSHCNHLFTILMEKMR